jgi:hypothetical protein
MADTLINSLERVDLDSASNGNTVDEWIDSILDSQRPRKRIKQDPDALKRSLEEKYLAPSTSFSTQWLNKLQQYAHLLKLITVCVANGILLADGGTPRQTSQPSSKSRLLRPVRLPGSHEKDSKDASLDIKKSQYLRIVLQRRTRLPSCESQQTERIWCAGRQGSFRLLQGG